MKKTTLLIFIAGIVLITLPSFFERLHSDEVIYWEVARNISLGRGAVSSTSGGSLFSWHMPLPFYISAPFLDISPHIFTSRVISSLFTVGSAIIIFLTAEKKYGRKEAVLSAFLFLLSFQALRFGGRFYLDQYGTFFFLLSFYFISTERFLYAGIFSVLAVVSREYWLGVYPFILFYIGNKRNIIRFTAPVFVIIVLSLAFSSIYGGNGEGLIKQYLFNGSIFKNMTASISNYGPSGYLYRVARGWLQFSILNILILTGFIAEVRRNKKFLLLIIPQLVITSLIHGFVVDGGVTQYPLALLACLSIYSGAGIKDLYNRFIASYAGRGNFLRLASGALFLQFVFFNAFATFISLHGNSGIYGFGFCDDDKVISILKKEAKGEFINGIHGAFIEERRGWDWTDYYIQEAIEKDPDWLITYSSYVDIISQENAINNLKIYRIGPYIVIHSLHGVPLSRLVRQNDSRKWMFGGASREQAAVKFDIIPLKNASLKTIDAKK